MRTLKKFWHNSAKPSLQFTKASIAYGFNKIFYNDRYYLKAELKFFPLITSSLMLGSLSVMGLQQVTAHYAQESVLENTYWDHADAADAKTAKADRATIQYQITTIKGLEKNLKAQRSSPSKTAKPPKTRFKTPLKNSTTPSSIIHP